MVDWDIRSVLGLLPRLKSIRFDVASMRHLIILLEDACAVSKKVCNAKNSKIAIYVSASQVGRILAALMPTWSTTIEQQDSVLSICSST